MGTEIQSLPSTINGHQYYPNVLASSHNDQNNNHHTHLNLAENRNGSINSNGCASNSGNGVDVITSTSGTNGATTVLPQHNINNRWTGPPPTALQSASEITDRYHNHQNGGAYNHYPNSRNPWCFNNIPQGYQRLYADNSGSFTSSAAQNQSQIIDQSAYAKHSFGYQQRGA